TILDAAGYRARTRRRIRASPADAQRAGVAAVGDQASARLGAWRRGRGSLGVSRRDDRVGDARVGRGRRWRDDPSASARSAPVKVRLASSLEDVQTDLTCANRARLLEQWLPAHGFQEVT